ncbi:MAG: outer membrane beta-barrel protein [Flavihumibacter sp.]|nr:outer membrane beta-barrel protein [Flavihumibacter sp.]
MFGPDFEKQVQQKMDAFQVPPSDAVWQAVEKEIQAKKKRRRILFWWPAAALLLAGLTYWMLPVFITSPAQKLPVTITKEPLPVETKKEPVAPADAVNDTTPGVAGKTAPVFVAPAPVKNQALLPVDQKTINSQKDIAKLHATLKPGAVNNVINKLSGTDAEPIAKTNTAVATTAAVSNNILPDTVPANTIAGTARIKDSSVVVTDAAAPAVLQTTDSIIAVVKKQSAIVTTDTVIAVEQKEAIQKKKQQKWQWGLQQSTGLARLTTGGFFSVFQSENKSFDNAFNNSTNGVPTVILYKPNAVKAGWHFAVGGFAQKVLTNKTSVLLGLQYQYNQNSIHVGAKIDTPVTVLPGVVVADRSGAAYQGGTANRYKIKQHLLVLPVSLQTQINKSEKKPLLLNYGLQLGWQLSNNFLHFGNTTGRYFTNKNYNNQLQAGMHTGIYFTLYNKKSHQITAGPSLQYYFSSLFTNQADTRHLFTAGVTTRFLFKK